MEIRLTMVSIMCFLSFILPCISVQAIVKKENNINVNFDIEIFLKKS